MTIRTCRAFGESELLHFVVSRASSTAGVARGAQLFTCDCLRRTQFEAWMGFQEVDSNGVLRCASETNRRCIIECIHNANEYTKLALIEMWSEKTPEEAYNMLKKDDVSVTNQKDKELQLPIIKTFRESVQQTWFAAVENGEITCLSSRSDEEEVDVTIVDVEASVPAL